MSQEFLHFLELIEQGLSVEDAAVLADSILPEEVDAWLDQIPEGRRQLARSEAKFRARMHKVLIDAAEIRTSVTAAKHYLTRKTDNRDQMKLDFTGTATVTMDMPDNGRVRVDKSS